jgi:hypothetical protein
LRALVRFADGCFGAVFVAAPALASAARPRQSDIVLVLQAGFVGVWGEWAYTDHFTTAALKNAVLGDLDDHFDPRIPIAVRTPAFLASFKAAALNVSNGGQEGESQSNHLDRFTLHNDCFLASATDYGTFADFAVESAAWFVNHIERPHILTSLRARLLHCYMLRLHENLLVVLCLAPSLLPSVFRRPSCFPHHQRWQLHDHLRYGMHAQDACTVTCRYLERDGVGRFANGLA